MMSILNNAIASIQIGVEDYLSKDERRMLSTVRNVTAGILLLYKAKLCELSPAYDRELLIKTDIRPQQDKDGNISFHAPTNCKKTVNVQQIKERFHSLGLKVDWKIFERINSIRTDIEHYYTNEPHDAIKEILAKSFVLIKDFIHQHLQDEPVDLLGDSCWKQLLNVAEVYESEKLLCIESLDKIDWKYKTMQKAKDLIRCPNCLSSLIKTDAAGEYSGNTHLTCSSCGHVFELADVLSHCIADLLYVDSYTLATDGVESTYDTCPECGEGTFVFEEGCCLACGYEMQYHECIRCGCGLSLEDQLFESKGMCDYCRHMFDKAMSE